VLFAFRLNARTKSDRSRSPLRSRPPARLLSADSGKANLTYVNDRLPGIRRIRRGNGFNYLYEQRPVRDKYTLARIKALVIPPAWKNVWICRNPAGHIQATGIDARGRKQYRYHREWNCLREKKKFSKLLDLGRRLPSLRRRIESDLHRPGLNRDKVLATAVKLIEKTSIRVGNAEYEKANGSFGLTTLKDKHADIKGDTIKLSFKGKKGVVQSLKLNSRRLARIVKACRDIPGQQLFQYIDENGHPASIDSGMVNEYIRTACCDDFTAKDLRTWCGSLAMLEALRALPPPKNKHEIKKNVIAALDAVSSHLGNTRSVCKSYYVHPEIIALYERGTLATLKTKSPDKGLSPDERSLMQILRGNEI
jgi:DNA topoisomerase-1